MYNRLLQRQIQKHFGVLNDIPENLLPVFKVISDSYDHYEKDRRMIERSIELSSNEMVELNNNLRKEKDELKKAHKELKTLFEDIDEVLYSVDMVSYKLIQISAACEKVYGFTAEEFFSDNDLWQKVVYAEDQNIAAQYLQAFYQGKQDVNQYRIIHKDKSIRWIENKIIPTFDIAGRLVQINGVTSDITKRKNNEEALKESEKRLRQIIDLVPHFIFAKDAKGKFTLANEAVADTYGCGVNDLIGKSDSDFNANEEEVQHFMQEDLEVINSGNAKYNIEEKITDAHGNIRNLSTTKIPYISSGDIPGILGISVDISERKKSETILRESEGQLSVATQIAKLGYWEFDVAKNLFKFNDQFYSIFKTTAEAIGGYTVLSDRYASLFVHPDDILIVAREAADAIKSPDPNYNHQIEHRIKYADGGIGHVAVRFFIVKNGQGRTIKVFGAIQDITEKKNAESALIERDNQLTIATQIAKLGYWEYDILNDVFTFNDQFYAIYKATAEKIGGYNMTSQQYSELFVHPDDRGIVGRKVADAINCDDPYFSHQLEHRIIFATGEIGYISVHFCIIKDDEGRTIKTFGVNQDITDRKKGEETLLRSEANLELKNKELELKNKELEQFAYVASHDLQEPLRTISSFVQLLQQQYYGKLDEKADKFINYILHSSDRMKVLISDLLEYSRIGDKKEIQVVNCNKVVQEVLEDLAKAIEEKQADIRFENLPVINGYPTEIKQLFQNLIMNAIKFRKKDKPPCIRISAINTDDSWKFTVQDNGIGIEEEHKERIFIIFQRLHTRNEYEGSGIGLSHCKKIVELHGGKIWVESKAGDGSTFHFMIPQDNN